MGYVVLRIVLITALVFMFDRQRKRILRRRLAQLNRLMSDEEFVHAVGVEAAAGAAACRVRGAIAAAMGVPAATLLLSDEWTYIGQFIGFDGMDTWDIEFILEKQLDITIPEKEWERYWAEHLKGDLATLIRFLAEQRCLSPAAPVPKAACRPR